MSDVMLYDVLGNDWRWGQDAHGVYTLASDVSTRLKYKQTKDALALVDEDEKALVKIPISIRSGRNDAGQDTYETRMRKQWVLYEDGIMELIFRSSLPEAKAIKKRVKQILREIRQDGIYIQDSMPEALRVRADEKFSYSKLKDFVMYASDYDPESEETRKAFARMQNDLYRKFVGMDASDIKAVRPVNMELLGKTRKDGKPYAADAKVAKNYLATEELSDINNAALAALGMLGLRMRSFKNGYTMQDVRMSLLKVLDSI